MAFAELVPTSPSMYTASTGWPEDKELSSFHHIKQAYQKAVEKFAFYPASAGAVAGASIGAVAGMGGAACGALLGSMVSALGCKVVQAIKSDDAMQTRPQPLPSSEL